MSRFHARWYPATLVPLAFDVEMLFIYPWAVVVAELGATPHAGSGRGSPQDLPVGALFGIMLLAGLTLLYGLAGATAYAEIGAGLREGPSSVVALGAVVGFGGLMFKPGGRPRPLLGPGCRSGGERDGSELPERRCPRSVRSWRCTGWSSHSGRPCPRQACLPPLRRSA